MDADVWQWIWLGAAVAFALGELVAPGTFFLISFAVGAAVAALLAFLDASLVAQWVAFVGITTVALALLVPFGRRLARHDGDEAQEGSTRWIGRVGIVLEKIPAEPHSTGRVRVERDEWRAETDGDLAISEGTQVEVLGVRGTRLVVAPTDAPERASNDAPKRGTP